MRAYTHGGWSHRQRVSTSLTRKKLTIVFLCSLIRSIWIKQIKLKASSEWTFTKERCVCGGEGGGENPHENLSENRYHILEVKIHRPNRGWNPHPQALVISSLGQNAAAPTLSHWTRVLFTVHWSPANHTGSPQGFYKTCTDDFNIKHTNLIRRLVPSVLFS